jgi:uncharacterized protein YbjT (DUF2867 family)
MSESKKSLVLVTGVTGHQGCGVVRHLLESGKYSVRGLIRETQKETADECKKKGIEVVHGDLNIAESLTDAVKGVDYAFLVTDYWDTMNEEKEIQAGKNFLDACKAASVKHVVFSGLTPVSLLSQGKSKVPHFDSKYKIEGYCRTLGISYTFVHYASYFENFLHDPLRPQKTDDDKYVLRMPLGEAKLGGVAVADGGAIVCKIFESPSTYKGLTISICSEILTGAEYAAQMSKALGKSIEYRPMNLEEFSKLKFEGVGEITEMFRFYQEYGTHIGWNPTESKKMYPGMQSFETWCQSHKECFKCEGNQTQKCK